MANILITGDSWACIPWQAYLEYYDCIKLSDSNNKKYILDNWTKSAKDQPIDNIYEWLDFQLIKLGHTVNNIGYWSVGNIRQIIRAKGYIDGANQCNQKIDLVIWFHTELVRDWSGEDWTHANKMGYYDYLQLTARGLYNYVTYIKEISPDTKWAIIGGHAALHEKEKHLLDWAEYRIDNWRENITGLQLPETHLCGELHWTNDNIKNLLSLDEKEKELEKIEKIVEACKDTKLFYDGVHPNVGPNKQLALDIIHKLGL